MSQSTQVPRGIDPASVGTAVLLGLVGRENASTKARRYLIEGRIVVRAVSPHSIRASARGQGAIYDLRWDRDIGWSCDCAARGRCSHLVGLQLVVAPLEPEPGGEAA